MPSWAVSTPRQAHGSHQGHGEFAAWGWMGTKSWCRPRVGASVPSQHPGLTQQRWEVLGTRGPHLPPGPKGPGPGHLEMSA